VEKAKKRRVNANRSMDLTRSSNHHPQNESITDANDYTTTDLSTHPLIEVTQLGDTFAPKKESPRAILPQLNLPKARFLTNEEPKKKTTRTP